MITIKLQNNLELHTKRIDNIGFVSFKICFRAGLVYEPKNKYGISHLLEHMLFRGVGKYSYENLERLFKNLGFEVYGKTGYDNISLSFSILSENFNESVDYICELFNKPKWSSDDLRTEKEIVKHEIAIKGTTFPKRIELLYDNDILKNSVLGCPSKIERITLREISEWFDKTVTPSNTILFVSGDFSSENYNLLLNSLSNIKGGLYEKQIIKANLLPNTLCNRKEQFNLYFDNYEYSDLYFNFDIDKRFQNCAKFIQFYLSGYTSPLSEELVDRKALSYELCCELDEWNGFGILIFYTSTKYNLLCQAIDIFQKELCRIKNEFSENDYRETLNFLNLEKRKSRTVPEEVIDNLFNKHFSEISDDIPTYEEIKKALNSIFLLSNFSCYVTYSIKRKDVISSLSRLRKSLN